MRNTELQVIDYAEFSFRRDKLALVYIEGERQKKKKVESIGRTTLGVYPCNIVRKRRRAKLSLTARESVCRGFVSASFRFLRYRRQVNTAVPSDLSRFSPNRQLACARRRHIGMCHHERDSSFCGTSCKVKERSYVKCVSRNMYVLSTGFLGKEVYVYV